MRECGPITTNVVPLLPKLALNRQLVEDLIAQDAPCFALGMVEERKQRFAALALRPGARIPSDISARGFDLGHSLLGTARFEVIHFAFEFCGFETYNVLINPNNPLVQTVVNSMIQRGKYFILVIGPDEDATAFRADVGPRDLIGLRQNIHQIQGSATTDAQYEAALAQFRRRPYPPGPMLEWVGRDRIASLDPSLDRLELSLAPPRGTATSDAEEQCVLAERLDAWIKELEREGAHDIELFTSMVEQMPLFQRLLDIAGADRMFALCDEYPGLYRYAKLLERVASGIETGDIEVPR